MRARRAANNGPTGLTAFNFLNVYGANFQFREYALFFATLNV